MLDNNTSELHPELMGLGNNLDPFGKHNSASRRKMFASHLSQALVIEGSTPKRIQTGAERELGKYTKAIEIDPNSANAYLNRGVAKENLGDMKGACDDWRKASSLGNESTAEWVRDQC